MPILILTSKEVFSKKIYFKLIFFFLRLPKTSDRIMCIQCISLPSCDIFGKVVFSLCISYFHDHFSYKLTFQCLMIFKKIIMPN